MKIKLKKNNEEEHNIKETYEKSLSLLSLKDTHREEARIKDRVAHLEKITELRTEFDDQIRRKENEIDKLKQSIKEKDRILDEHNMELEKIKLQHRQAECNMRQKLDDIQFQTTDFRMSQDNFSSQLQMNNKNYEETILKFREKQNELKSEIKQLKHIIKKINAKNEILESENTKFQTELSVKLENK